MCVCVCCGGWGGGRGDWGRGIHSGRNLLIQFKGGFSVFVWVGVLGVGGGGDSDDPCALLPFTLNFTFIESLDKFNKFGKPYLP